jgi:hypothetical protein
MLQDRQSEGLRWLLRSIPERGRKSRPQYLEVRIVPTGVEAGVDLPNVCCRFIAVNEGTKKYIVAVSNTGLVYKLRA